MKKLFVPVFLCVLATVLCIAYNFYEASKRAEARENLVWRARIEFDYMKKYRAMEFLELVNYKCEEDLVTLDYSTILSDSIFMKLTDSRLLLDDFYSVLVVDKSRWDTVFCYLEQAKVDLCIAYNCGSSIAACLLKSDTLSMIMSDSVKMERGRELFAQRKSDELMQYAKKHFRGDRYLRPEKVDLDKDYITLKLSFDDSKYDIDISLRDTSHVASHFTDNVGDLGSLLDGMLNICVCSHRGFTIEYNGKHKKKKYRCEWPYQKALGMVKSTRHLYVDEKKTNRVHSVVGR